MDSRRGFGQALRAIRKAKGLTQEDFSDVSSRTYLSTLERGLKSPTLEKVDQLAIVLGVHPLTLLALAYSMMEKTDVVLLLELVAGQTSTLTKSDVEKSCI